MPGKRFTAEKIITMLREAEVLLSTGKSSGEVCRELNISEQTYYRWRKEYGGMRVDQAKKLKMLESENQRLKTLVADLSLDNAILKDTVSGNRLPGQAKRCSDESSGEVWDFGAQGLPGIGTTEDDAAI